jgi:beta-N-acetylhexosaminidase
MSFSSGKHMPMGVTLNTFGRITNNMTLEEQIGQLLVVGFHGTRVPQTLRDLIEHHHVGNIILFSRNIQNTQQLLELTHDLQSIAKAAGQRSPLLIMLDQENGMVRRLGQGATIFPGNMALGAIGSEEIAYDIAQATGRELKALGINMNLAPVVDVNNNPANPVIGIRSFGEDPRQVARLAVATIKGYQAAGIVSNLKHFPGHGDTSVDSHMALPTIPYTLERLEQVELVPFRNCIQAGADSIMTAHIYFPALMPDVALPATVSPAIIQGLLRQQLGFDGVIISDCMEMNAILSTIGPEQGTVMALQAGVDLVLISHVYERQRDSLAAIQAAIQAGQLSTETLRLAAEHVLRLKERYLSWDTDIPLSEVGSKEHRQLSERAYALSTTLVRNDEQLLPLHLQPGEQILVIYPQEAPTSKAQDKFAAPTTLVEGIQKRHANTQSIAFSARISVEGYRELLRKAQRAAVIIIATINTQEDEHQAELMHQLLKMDRPLIGIAVYGPYDLLSFPQLRTYLATYEYTPPALEAAVHVLFGEIEPQGHLPVTLLKS